MEEKKKYDTIETMHGTFLTTLNKKQLARKPWVPADDRQIKSFIPGTVVEILVKVGQSVAIGDMLMVYKAMKMNNNIRATQPGKVKKILVKEGDNLPNRTVMIEME